MPSDDEKPKAADAGIKQRVDETDDSKTFSANETERELSEYVKRRIAEMQDYRRSLNIEPRWREADEEYIPHELDFGTTRKRFETDQDTGLRSRMVPVGDVTQQWRSATSAPTLLAKIQTAISIIVDQQPEAELVPLLKKFAKTTDLSYALWKRNWQITDAKEKLKLTIFNLIKYGWAPQRTYPRKVEYDKRVLVEKDTENPENDKYEARKNLWFDDVDREPLNPFRTWIDEQTKPYDVLSMNECYYEIDYSYDQFIIEFGQYPNSKYVKRDSSYIRTEENSKANRQSVNMDIKTRKDIVTVGFFENRLKDLFCIFIPKDGVVVYTSPLPNDDGYLSVSHTLWLLRNAKIPYGVSLWEIIRQNKQLYDKTKNMTMDQLVLSIMKFGFTAGTSMNLGDGTIEVVPGQTRQVTSSTGKPEVTWMEIPGPGEEAWDGIKALDTMMDDESGISPTLEGEITGKTLGEILHAKEAALKRMKIPVDNIAWLIEQDAYITLSWMSQLYAIPMEMEFVDEQTMMDFEKENDINRYQLFADTDEDGSITKLRATYLPQLALHLEDSDGNLVKSKESSFFQIGKDIQPHQLKWRGIFKVIPRSLIDSSETLVKAQKMEMFNLLIPLFQLPPQLAAKAAQQIIKINEEDPKDWLPDDWLAFLDGTGVPQPNLNGQPPPTGSAAGGGLAGLFTPNGQPPQGGQTMQPTGTPPVSPAQTVVPQGQVTAPSASQLNGGLGKGGGLFSKGLM